MAFEDYHASRSTLERLENTFKNGYLTVLKLIAKSPDFFNNEITAEELFHTFVEIPFNEIKEKENPSNRSELKKNIKKIVLGSDESEN
mgnify:CR=1 FL=1